MAPFSQARKNRLIAVVLPHVTLLPGASSRMIPGSTALGALRIGCGLAYGSNESLHSLLPPDSYSLLQCVELPHLVVPWIPRLELDKQLEGRLIGLHFQALRHLRPVLFEGIPGAAAGLGESVGLGADLYTSGLRVAAPAVHTPKQRRVLPRSKAAGELRADLIEELHRADVRKSLKSSVHDGPSHAQRVDSGRAALGVYNVGLFLQHSRRWLRRWRRYGSGRHGRRNDPLQAAQIARLSL